MSPTWAMIYYEPSWFGLIFRYRGTILQSTWHLIVVLVLIKLLCYYYEVFEDCQLGSEGHTILGSTMSYLLVFRANTASERFWYSRKAMTQLFLSMRGLVMLMCATMKGGGANELWRSTRHKHTQEDANDIRASMARVNFIRWSLAFVISLKLHTRICNDGYMSGRIDSETKRMVDLDRIRLRALMTRQEFEELNVLIPIFNEPHITKGASVLTHDLIEEALDQDLDDWYEVDTTPDMRQPLAILLFLRMEITRHANEAWGFKERFSKDMMGFCNAAGNLYEIITMVVTTPIPFPYVHLCKVLLLIFLMVSPLLINAQAGFFDGVVLPSFIALSLLGIDAIAAELENPLGDDYNDLDVTGFIALFESECMKLLDVCGDHKARRAFTTYIIPEHLLSDDPRAPTEFVCLRSQVVDGHVSKAEKAIHLAEEAASPTAGSKGRSAGGDEDDPTRPLLEKPESMPPSSRGSGGFVPMATMSSSTVSLAEIQDGGSFRDEVIGLSDGEDEEPASDRQPKPSAAADESKGNRSARIAEEEEAQEGQQSPAPSSGVGSGQSGRGFKPMELGTCTIVLDDDDLGAVIEEPAVDMGPVESGTSGRVSGASPGSGESPQGSPILGQSTIGRSSLTELEVGDTDTGAGDGPAEEIRDVESLSDSGSSEGESSEDD